MTGIRDIARDYAKATAYVLAETAWPTRCAVCDAPGETLCEPCRKRLRRIDWWRACKRCGSPFGAVQCCDCNELSLSTLGRDHPGYDGCASAVLFDDDAGAVIRTWKDAGERRLVEDIAALTAPLAHPDWLAQTPSVVPIPASRVARRRRGFDHGEELGRALAGRLGLPFAPVLAPPVAKDQRELRRRSRQHNMDGAFVLAAGARAPAAVILTDDVHTTGATLYAAADALHAAGAERVWALTFARVC